MALFTKSIRFKISLKNSDLPALVTIISVPSSLNSSQRGFISRWATTPASFGWSGFFSGSKSTKALSPASAGLEAADDDEPPVGPPGAEVVVVEVVAC